VAGGCQKAALGTIGPFGILACRDKGIANRSALGHTPNGRRNKTSITVLERRQPYPRGEFRAIGPPREQVADARHGACEIVPG